MWLNSWNILHCSLKRVASDLKHKIISWHSYYVLSFSDKSVVIKPIACCTCDYCPTLKLHDFVDTQCYKLTRDKTSKNSYMKISLASGSIRIFLMETSNISCQKDLEIYASPYILHRSEFTTPSIEKETSQYWFYPDFLRKNYIASPLWVFLTICLSVCSLAFPQKNPKQNKPLLNPAGCSKPYWTEWQSQRL